MTKRKSRTSSPVEKQNSVNEDSDGTTAEPPNKRRLTQPLSSAEWCKENSIEDVNLEYNEADFMNLTSFNLYSRMIRPQIAAANLRIPSGKMSTLLEMKWKEFQALCAQNQTAAEPVGGDEEGQEEDEIDEDSEEGEEMGEEEVGEDGEEAEEEEGEDGKEEGEEEEESIADENEDEEEEEEEGGDEEEPAPNARPCLSLKVRLPIFGVRRSTRERKAVVRAEFDDDSDNGAQGKRGKTKAKNDDMDTEEEEEEIYDNSESDYEEKPKRRSRKHTKKKEKRRERKKTKQVVDTASDDYEDSGGDSADSDEEKWSSSTKRAKPVIPGERKSERARAKKSMSQMTDREFEKIMKTDDSEKKKRRERAAQKAKAKAAQKAKKAATSSQGRGVKVDDNEGQKQYWTVMDGDGDGNNSDHSFYCVICKDGGQLLLCDTCPKSYHKECLKIDVVPDGEWSCPICAGEILPKHDSDPDEAEEGEEEASEEAEDHQHACRICKDGGEMLLCDFCPCVYHMRCLNPPLLAVPEGDWKCPLCVVLEKPLRGQIQKVLTWRWTHQEGADELDHTHSPRKKSESQKESDNEEPQKKPEREILVKYKYHSYWDCEWIQELAFEAYQLVMYRFFKTKWDQDEPPALEDGGSMQQLKHRTKAVAGDLQERFYKYGVKPEWLRVHRILVHDGKKNVRYLVKWRGLPYEEATWEVDTDIPPEARDDWNQHEKLYWAHRKEKLRRSKEVWQCNKKKKALLKKLDKQPAKLCQAGGGNLHPYQLEGLNWLRFSWAQNTNTILADEMGLGKTIQTIAFLSCLYDEGYSPGPFLISAPLSTVPNWEREFEFWAPELYVVTYTGGKMNRAVIRERDFTLSDNAFAYYGKAAKLRAGCKPKFDVLLTSYEMSSVDQVTLQSIDWSMLVIDEAHRLKNNESLYFRTLSQFNFGYKLLLTGTPLQNTLEELFSLLNFLEPDEFADMNSFLSEFTDATKEEQVSRLHAMLAPHMLRRLKSDVLKDIPSKTELIVRVELSALQKKFYKHILTRNYDALNVRGHSNQTSLLNIMMDLRKCCNHPYLFPSAENDAPLTRKGLYEGTGLTRTGGKLDLLAKMLRALKQGGHRVLIFSQMTRMLDILEDFMVYMEFKYERLDGSTQGDKRQASIDRFNAPNADQFVFLLSTRAGGLGLNLATADTVVIYDMDWNPHNDIQAFSRAHRIGQQNKVLIYRFVSKDTVEEKIIQVCKQKMMLTELIIHKGLGSSEKKDSLSKQEVNDILKFGAERLFKDDEEGKVVYDDAAIAKLVDRDQESQEQHKEFGLNEYLRSFKVASYQVKESQMSDEEEAKESADTAKPAPTPSTSTTAEEDDSHYWERILGVSYSVHMDELRREQAEIAKGLGKGKRIRKQINYAESQMLEAAAAASSGKKKEEIEEDHEEEDVETKYLSDYEPDTSDSDYSGDEEAETKDKEDKEGSKQADDEGKENKPDDKQEPTSKKRKKKHSSVALPPLLTKVSGQIQVLGLTPRQRRVFLDTVMKFGLPPENAYKSQWANRELRSIPEKVFKAYVSLFLRHLCEPISDSAEKFADGVPREGLSNQHVLTRIGVLALIRRKVEEFEEVNGRDSMLEFLDHYPPGRLTAHTEEQRMAYTKKIKLAQEMDAERREAGKQREGKDVLDKELAEGKDGTEKIGEGKDEKDSDGKGGMEEGKDGKESEKKDGVKETEDGNDGKTEVEEGTEGKESEKIDGQKETEDGKSSEGRGGMEDETVGKESEKKDGEKETGEGKSSKRKGDMEDGTVGKQSEKMDGEKETEEWKEGKVSEGTGEMEEDQDGTAIKGKEAIDEDKDEHDMGKDTQAGNSTENKEGKKDEGDTKDDENEQERVTTTEDNGAEKDDTKDNEEISIKEGKDEPKEDMVDEDKSILEESNARIEHEEMEADMAEKEMEAEKDIADATEKDADVSQPDTVETMEVDSCKGSKMEALSNVDASDNSEQRDESSKVVEKAEGEVDSSKSMDVDGSGDKESSNDPMDVDTSESTVDTSNVADSSEGKDDPSKVMDGDSSEDKGNSLKVKDSSEDKVMDVDSSEKKNDLSKVKDSSEHKVMDVDSSEDKVDSSTVKDSSEDKVMDIDLPEVKDDSSKNNSESKDDSSKDADSSQGKSDLSQTTSSDGSQEKDGSSKVITIDLCNDKNDEKEKESTKEAEESTSKTPAPAPPLTLAELMAQLRRRLWIADGGLTDVHRVWMIEEQMMTPTKEFATWHRRHDYWLLAGIVAHGYRNWQDILADPNFDILSRAFTTSLELFKMSAFLNRRFQLLSQAIVIEEQLSKAVRENETGIDEMTTQDRLRAVDKLAGNMRRVGQGQPPLGIMSEKKLHVVLNTVTALANDIRVTTSQGFPATLYPNKPATMPPTRNPPGMLSTGFVKKMLSATSTKSASNTSVIQLD